MLAAVWLGLGSHFPRLLCACSRPRGCSGCRALSPSGRLHQHKTRAEDSLHFLVSLPSGEHSSVVMVPQRAGVATTAETATKISSSQWAALPPLGGARAGGDDLSL